MTWHVIINRHQMMTCYVASCPPAARRALLTPAAPCCQLLGARARGFRSPCGRTAGAPRGDECPRRGGGRDRGGRARSEVTLGRQRHHQSARRWAPCCLPPRTCPQPPAARCAPVAGPQMRLPRRCRPRCRPSRQSPPAGLHQQATSHFSTPAFRLMCEHASYLHYLRCIQKSVHACAITRSERVFVRGGEDVGLVATCTCVLTLPSCTCRVVVRCGYEHSCVCTLSEFRRLTSATVGAASCTSAMRSAPCAPAPRAAPPRPGAAGPRSQLLQLPRHYAATCARAGR